MRRYKEPIAFDISSSSVVIPGEPRQLRDPGPKYPGIGHKARQGYLDPGSRAVRSAGMTTRSERWCWLAHLSAQELADRDALGGERLAQHRDAGVGIGGAAHEDVDGGVVRLRPGMDRDVALGEHGHAGDTAVRLEVVQVHVQQRGAGGGDAAAQRVLDVIDVVQPIGLVEVDDEMRAGAPHPVPHHEMIVALLGPYRSGGLARGARADRRVFLSGGTWGPQARPQLEEGVLAHAVLPHQRSKPERPASRLTDTKMPPDRPKRGPCTATRPHISPTFPGCKRFLAPSTSGVPCVRHFNSAGAGHGPFAVSCASTTATAVMLTTPRAVTEGVRMWAGRAAPMRMGPTGSASATARIIWSAMLAASRVGMIRTLASPLSRACGNTRSR